MFRIRQVGDASLPVNQREIAEVQQILRSRFSAVPEEEVEDLPEKLRDPVGHKLQSTLLVADDLRGNLRGFALLSYAPDLEFWYLDFIASGKEMRGGGIGGALYQRVRETAAGLPSIGLFFECLPDDPEACSNPEYVKDNAARLRFYERFGARPIVGTGYELPIHDGDKNMPYLVYDDLDTGRPLSRDDARKVVRAILERKYHHLCPPEYVDKVVDSIRDDPVRIRGPRYVKLVQQAPAGKTSNEDKIVVVVNDRHDIHHVRERGYVEAPARVNHILRGIEPTGLFFRVPPREYPETYIRSVHDPRFVDYLKAACRNVEPQKSIYPYVFPIRNATRRPKDATYAAGYYCIDTFTPLNRNAFLAAKRAVDCTLTAADALLSEQRLAYSLVRPPGHHAERRTFGGFCYFCNGAIAAHYLSRYGRVAILDIDYHHGNGQQDIFYARPDVFTVSIHGHPRFAYPFFVGFENEIGEGTGEGYNLNITLPEKITAEKYHAALAKALRRIKKFEPRFLVVSLGMDTAKGDPTGTWSLRPQDFETNGRMIGEMGLPTLIVQEGGYRSAQLGSCARRFFLGLHGASQAAVQKNGKKPAGAKT